MSEARSQPFGYRASSNKKLQDTNNFKEKSEKSTTQRKVPKLLPIKQSIKTSRNFPNGCVMLDTENAHSKPTTNSQLCDSYEYDFLARNRVSSQLLFMMTSHKKYSYYFIFAFSTALGFQRYV